MKFSKISSADEEGLMALVLRRSYAMVVINFNNISTIQILNM
jgi:hypothetical protein